jgi:hypothetical protein
MGACAIENFADGTSCTDDANVCTDDVCDGGLCTHPANSAPCSDGNFCTTDDHCAFTECVGTCSGCCGGSACTPAPASACKGPTTSAGQLKFRLDSDGTSTQRVVWSWKKGDATAVGDFGEPALSTGYAFCLYRSRAPTGTTDLILAADVPPAAYCLQPTHDYATCWKPNAGKGFDFKNTNPDSPSSSYDGIRRMSLRAGAAGRASAKVKAIGTSLRTQL